MWLQEKVGNGDIQVMKVKGEVNLADALPKALDGPGTKKHLELSGQEIVEGRHSLTPDFAKEEQEVDEEEGQDAYPEEEWVQEVRRLQSGLDVFEML